MNSGSPIFVPEPDAVQLGFGNNYATDVGIPGVNVTDNNSGFPGIIISGYGLLGDSPFFPLD